MSTNGTSMTWLLDAIVKSKINLSSFLKDISIIAKNRFGEISTCMPKLSNKCFVQSFDH